MNRHARTIAAAAVIALLCAATALWSDKQADKNELIALNIPDSSRWESEVNAADQTYASKRGGSWTMSILNPINTEYSPTSNPVLHPGKDQPESVCMHYEGSANKSDSPSDGQVNKNDVSDYTISGFSTEGACEKIRAMLDHRKLVREQTRENADIAFTRWSIISKYSFLAAAVAGGFAGVWVCLRLLFAGWLAFIRATSKAIRGE